MSRGTPDDLEFRRDLRRDATEAERAVWWIVRNRHLGAPSPSLSPEGSLTISLISGGAEQAGDRV
jgi:hypothetical protein